MTEMPQVSLVVNPDCRRTKIQKVLNHVDVKRVTLPVCHIVENTFVSCLARPYPTDYQLESKSLARGCEHLDGGSSKLTSSPCSVSPFLSV